MIKFKNVTFTYKSGERNAGVQDINLTIAKGETVLLCGESGCGKTTVTRLINGLIPHYYDGDLLGEISIDGKDISEMPLYETSKIVGSVFQNPRSQFFNLDTTSELAFSCENQGLPADEIIGRIESTVKTLNLQHLKDRSLFELSGGEKQKIACASVSVGRPDVYVLDEPSSNLDSKGIEELRKMLKVWKAEGKTIVIAEHRLYFLWDLIDTVLYMKNGQITEKYNAEKIKKMDNDVLAKMGLRPIDMSLLSCKSKGKVKAEELMKLENFNFAYKNNNAMNFKNIELPQGGIIAIVGHNGAGKSTFARCLCGLEKSFKGVLKYNSKQIKSKERLSKCYMVMQDVNHQLFTESVLDEVLLSMANADEKIAEDILNELDLTDFKELHPMSLSGGQKQRVAIASAVASERSIIIFDEPTSGLDLCHMNEVANILIRLRDMGKTLFVISHDAELILSCCNYIMQVENGKLVNSYPLNFDTAPKLLKFFYENKMSKRSNGKLYGVEKVEIT